MKHTAEFERFLLEEVNLDKSRIQTLRERVESIQKFLEGSDYRAEIIGFSPQGSWAHKTIIKPPIDQGFDADVLVFVKPIAVWSAADYVTHLRDEFKRSGTYKDKVHLHTRCVRLEYSGDFEIDVVPCVVNRFGGSYYLEVCNRAENEFEPTDGEAYTAWLAQRNEWTGTDKLREVTRLLKYLRDRKTTFSCKSILLTTLLGMTIEPIDAVMQGTYFPDLPTALKTLIGRLDNYLQARPDLHDICNPVLPQENFNRHWDQDRYSNFRDMIHKYRGWVDDAYNETDEARSITNWQRVFGDEWGKSLSSEELMENASSTALATVDTSAYGDLVQAVKVVGSTILSRVRTALPWVKTPPWQGATSGKVQVTVQATVHEKENGPSLGEISSGAILPKRKAILLQALTSMGIPLSSKEFRVQWQVVNTDKEAIRANQLRGGFYPSDGRAKRWEHTQYRGVHWVQAFVVRKRDGRCIGRSERFFVVIE